MAGARGKLGSVFGCEGFGPGQSCFQAAGETRAADPGRPDIAVIRDNETMTRVVAVFVEGGRSEAQRPSLPLRGSEAAEDALRGLSPVGRLR